MFYSTRKKIGGGLERVPEPAAVEFAHPIGNEVIQFAIHIPAYGTPTSKSVVSHWESGSVVGHIGAVPEDKNAIPEAQKLLDTLIDLRGDRNLLELLREETENVAIFLRMQEREQTTT